MRSLGSKRAETVGGECLIALGILHSSEIFGEVSVL